MTEHTSNGVVLDGPEQRQRVADQAFNDRERARHHAEATRRADALAEHEQQVNEAEADYRRAVEAARMADNAVAPARQALKDFDREHAGRLDDVHRAIDASRERAETDMRRRLVNSAERLATAGQDGEHQALDLAPLAGAWAAADPAFSAELHRLVDELVESGHLKLSRLSAEEIAEQRTPLVAAFRAAERALVAAREESSKAARWLTFVETGVKPTN